MLEFCQQPEEQEDALSTCSSHSRRSASSSLRRHVLSSQHSHTSSIMDVCPLSDSDSDDEPLHPLMKLAKAARRMNPKQMELRKDIGCHIQLPGESATSSTLSSHNLGMEYAGMLVLPDTEPLLFIEELSKATISKLIRNLQEHQSCIVVRSWSNLESQWKWNAKLHKNHLEWLGVLCCGSI